jgi:hypothetical protein
MDNVQRLSNFIHTPLSQTFRLKICVSRSPSLSIEDSFLGLLLFLTLLVSTVLLIYKLYYIIFHF